MNTITFYIGDENRYVLENIDNDIINTSIFSEQYKKSLHLIDNYCSLRLNSISKSTPQSSNVFTFIGDRGTGKTSCMTSIVNLLRCKDDKKIIFTNYPNVEKTKFEALDLIEPSYFDEKHNIISLIVSILYSRFWDVNEKGNFTNYSGNPEVDKREILKLFDRVQKNLSSLFNTENFDDSYGLESLSELSAAVELGKTLKKLIDKLLKYISKDDNNILIIPIDDIDLNASEAVKMLELIRKYLLIPNVIILIAVKLDQITLLKKQEYLEQYATIISKKEMNQTVVNSMADKYLGKLMPNGNRIFLPEPSYYLNSPLIIKDGEKKEKFVTVRQCVTQLIYNKTNYLFYNSEGKTSYIVPQNLREIRQFIGLLYDMKDYELNKSNDKEDNDASLNYNRVIFRQYFFGNWLMNNLSHDDQTRIHSILDIRDPYQINAYILNVIRDRFNLSVIQNINEKNKDLEKRFDEEDDIDEPTSIELSTEMKYILAPDNKYYNISLGDVLSLIQLLEREFQDEETRKFLFVIKSFCSITLENFYDEWYKSETASASNNAEDTEEYGPRSVDTEENKKITEEIELYSENNLVFDKKAPYFLSFVAGNYYNSRLEKMLPQTNKKAARDNRLIDIEALKNKIRDYTDEEKWVENNRLEIQVIEFFMLCISRRGYNRHQKNNSDYYYPEYRESRKLFYKDNLVYNKYAIFDIASFFYNILDVQACYSRFTQGSAFYEIARKKELSLFSCINKKIMGDGNAFKYSEWISKCAIRNVEVLDGILASIHSKDVRKGSDITLLKSYFDTVCNYAIQNYDISEEDKEYCTEKLDYIQPIVDLLKNLENLSNNDNTLKFFYSLYSLKNSSRTASV